MGRICEVSSATVGRAERVKSCKHVELALTKTVTCFKSKLDEFWPYQQDIIYDFRAEITATVNWNNM